MNIRPVFFLLPVLLVACTMSLSPTEDNLPISTVLPHVAPSTTPMQFLPTASRTPEPALTATPQPISKPPVSMTTATLTPGVSLAATGTALTGSDPLAQMAASWMETLADNYRQLPVGEYILYNRPLNPGFSLNVIALDGGYQTTLLESTLDEIRPNTRVTGISGDGRYILMVFYTSDHRSYGFVHDVANNTSIALDPKLMSGCEGYQLSPNNWQLVAECIPEGIIIYSLQSHVSTVFVADPPSPYAFSPVWSPDGKQVAYNVGYDYPKVTPFPRFPSGIYTVDVACLYDPSRCGQPNGPFLTDFSRIQYYNPHKLAWSPDGRRLLTWSLGEAAVYDLQAEKQWVFTMDFDGDGDPSDYDGNLAWLPDSNHIVSSSYKGIYIFSLTDGKWVLFKENLGMPLGSFSIIPPFAPGLELSVSLAGHDLNLRAEPSLGGAVLRKLAPGTRLTILEGPVEADGYTWWKMQTEDGSEGWAVEVGVWYQPVSGE